MTSILGMREPRDFTSRMNAPQGPPAQPVAIPRPQVGIERLPTRRPSNEPRELMNCKSCRKRKIKCNRLRPACEACQVFQCPCIYDATPKKRGPKGDVLEALLRRVDGLEAKLKEKNSEEDSPPALPETSETSGGVPTETIHQGSDRPTKRVALHVDTSSRPPEGAQPFPPLSAVPLSAARESPSSPVQTDTLLDTYFNRLHAKPYYILDESSIRQRMQLGQLPAHLTNAILAVAARYTPHPRGYQAAVKLSEEYAALARQEINSDEPSVDGLQSSLLLVIAFTAAGKGKKAYMLMTIAVGMATALEMHREMDSHARVTPVERELRRRLFWTCYLLDRYNACGSRRPYLLSDKVIMLRLPCWSPNPSSLPIDGEFFQSASNQQPYQGAGKGPQGSSGMLIDITRILGVTNRYLAAGGVKGDSHFPWHSLSRLSKIRQELDSWVAGTDGAFASLETLFGQVDSTVPFLPIDLSELAGNAQHQSWQIEATNLCFLHANAISELIDMGKQTNALEWPSFVGYCICTAATVHIHGAHYTKQGMGSEMQVFSTSAEFLSREMQQLSELRYAWASVQHQRETLQGIYNAHAELVQSLGSGPLRQQPGFQLEDFFNRYQDIGGPGGRSYIFDAANLSLSDIEVDFTADAYNGDDLFAPRVDEGPDRPSLKRKHTAPAMMGRPSFNHSKIADQSMGGAINVPGPTRPRQYSMPQRASPAITGGQPGQRISGDGTNVNFATNATGHGTSILGQLEGQQFGHAPGAAAYDPMFGTLPTNTYSSPAAWQAEPGGNGGGLAQGKINAGVLSGNAQAPSPSNRSTGTQGEEKDPFLSLLEQLAENEQRMNAGGSGGGGELDFLSGFGGPG